MKLSTARVAALLMLLLAAGCTSTAVRPPVDDPVYAWEQHRKKLEQVDQWLLVGRIAVLTQSDGVNADINWRQVKKRYEIHLDGPLGSGSLALSGDRHGVTLRSSEDEKVHYARDAESLLYRQTGLRMPIQALYYWVRGLPQPDMPVDKTLDAYGRLAQLEQNGWSVEFKGYTQADGVEIPIKVFASNHRLKVKLIVDQWQLAGFPMPKVAANP